MAQLVRTARRPHHRTLGFTLIEMMVVIGLIALISMWVIPGIRKAYEDFKVKETVSHVDTFITGFRSHYLVRSEFPEDSTTNLIHPRFTWCLPSSYFTRTIHNTRYYLNITPYEGSYYDIDNWIASGSQNFHITLYTDVPDKWYTRLREKYSSVIKRSNYVTVEDFYEINFGVTFEESAWRNRYY